MVTGHKIGIAMPRRAAATYELMAIPKPVTLKLQIDPHDTFFRINGNALKKHFK